MSQQIIISEFYANLCEFVSVGIASSSVLVCFKEKRTLKLARAEDITKISLYVLSCGACGFVFCMCSKSTVTVHRNVKRTYILNKC